MIVAIQTARKGSKTVVDKNISDVNGKPLFLHSIDIVNESRLIDHVFVSTDCPVIKSCSKDGKFCVIDRPEYLAGDKSSHHETMIHAILAAEIVLREKIDLIVFLLGNTICAPSEDVDMCIQDMINNKKIDSIQSVSKFNMFNPYRAYTISPSGNLINFIDSSNIEAANDKNSAGDVWFNNGSFFICRRDTVILKKGLSPFPWLGHNIKPFKEDTKMEVDAQWQLNWLRNSFMEKNEK
jgi:N-acylneuraminate cytidylyltransferase